MAEYKKKNVKKAKKITKNVLEEEIVMKPKVPSSKKKSTKFSDVSASSNQSNKKNLRVIKGKKQKNKQQRAITAAVVLVLVFTVVIFQLFLPTGIPEAVVNLAVSFGNGNGYPVSLSGGSLVNTVSSGNVFFTVSSTNIEAYNLSGKNILSYQHGFSSPVLCASESRFLIYNQGSKEFRIYNLNKCLFSSESDNDILSATICRNGTYAIATISDSYASQVTVYNRENQQIYRWYCSEYIINSVTLSNDGKKLAVSAINANNGDFISKLYILEYNTATPVTSFTYENNLLLSLRSYSNSSFCAVFEEDLQFFTWGKYENKNYKPTCPINNIANNSNRLLSVCCRSANKSENTLNIFNKKGELVNSFDFNGIITDIKIKGRYIYILSDKNICIYNLNGELISTSQCEFGVKQIIPSTRNTVIGVSDNSISKINFNNSEGT